MILLSVYMDEYGWIDGMILKDACEGEFLRLCDLEFFTSLMVAYNC